VLLGDGAQRQHVAAAGIGEQHVQAAGLACDLRIHRVQFAEHRGVGADAGGVGADRVDGRVQLGLAAAGDEDLGALGGQFLGGAEADARAAPGHQGDLSFELPVHVQLRSVVIEKLCLVAAGLLGGTVAAGMGSM